MYRDISILFREHFFNEKIRWDCERWSHMRAIIFYSWKYLLSLHLLSLVRGYGCLISNNGTADNEHGFVYSRYSYAVMHVHLSNVTVHSPLVMPINAIMLRRWLCLRNAPRLYNRVCTYLRIIIQVAVCAFLVQCRSIYVCTWDVTIGRNVRSTTIHGSHDAMEILV